MTTTLKIYFGFTKTRQCWTSFFDKHKDWKAHFHTENNTHEIV